MLRDQWAGVQIPWLRQAVSVFKYMDLRVQVPMLEL